MLIEYTHYNERDVEIPSLLGAVKNSLPKITSLLDVGARYSYPYYVPSLRLLLEARGYSAIDIHPDLEVEEIVDEYIIGDLLDISLGTFSYITCVSVIEHVGLKDCLSSDFKLAQTEFLIKLLNHAEAGVFLTFPFGRPFVVEGEYSNITGEDFLVWGKIAQEHGYGGEAKFWFNPFAQGREKWKSISFEEACEVEALPEKGCRCIGVVEFSKANNFKS